MALDVGDSRTLQISFYDTDDALFDPTTVTLTVTPPSGTATVYTYAAAEITKVSNGVYSKIISLTEEGYWDYSWKGVAGDTSIVEKGGLSVEKVTGGLTGIEILDFRGDIGDTGSTPAFSAAEIQRLYERNSSDYNRTMLMAIEQLIGNAWRFHNYEQGSSRDQRQQIFENLRKLRAIWKEKVDSGTQVRIVGMRTIPPRKKETP